MLKKKTTGKRKNKKRSDAILDTYGFSNTIDTWEDKIFRLVDQVTSSPAFPAIATLIIFAIACWAISYFSRK